MEVYKDNIIKILNSYKCKNRFDELKLIPVYNDLDVLVSFLKPLTFHYKVISPSCVELISKWRKENPIGFASIFEITEERTEKWLNNLLLNREDRILFMIESIDGESFGHLGFSSFNFYERSCEIDNVVRGVKDVQKGLMTFSMKSIMQWGLKVLNLNSIYLRVLSDNEHAVKFYEKIGFIKLYNIPLYKEIRGDEIIWTEAIDHDKLLPDRFYTYMKLESQLG